MANKASSWGGKGGAAWDWNPGSDSSIIEIVINYGDVVDSVAFVSFNSATGKTVFSGTHGGKGGASRKILIDKLSGEYLSLISGKTRDNYCGKKIIGSLTFHTNLHKYGPFGVASVGDAFEIPMENGKIVGFFGRAGNWVDALGIYVTPSAK
ncbi:hypothetical protein EZV62_017385 [Acer yangbiense]|uniref:Jacalin-type lectin domain-containing protein n=1 Tax=Acer yangbiense TaxID=1000413 RepID=A0A5C7HI61_9ROSI|nr:hypothetical protein EZV62_017385 [Acer yangbiense]